MDLLPNSALGRSSATHRCRHIVATPSGFLLRTRRRRAVSDNISAFATLSGHPILLERPLPAVVSGFPATWPVTPIDIFRVPIVARSIAPGRTAPAR